MPKSLHRDLKQRQKGSSSRLIGLFEKTSKSDSKRLIIVKEKQNEFGELWFKWAFLFDR